MNILKKTPPPAFIGVFLVSMAILALEVSLTRFFSFTIWYHFAYLTINIALLGFGASGAFIAVFPGVIEKYGDKLLIGSSIISSLLILVFLLGASNVPLQPQVMFKQPIIFTFSVILYYVGVSLPFFFAGVAITVPLKIYSHKVSQLYFWDLAGAGFGALLSLVVLGLAGAPGGIIASACLLLVAAGFFAFSTSRPATIALLVAGLVGLALTPYLSRKIEVVPSSSTYVAMVYANPSRFKLLHSEWNAIGRVDVYQDTAEKDRFEAQWTYDGISKRYPQDGSKPFFYFMMYESHNRSDICQFNGQPNDVPFLDNHLLKTPYIIKDKPNVLIIGSGGGIDVINAYKSNASSITAIELQPVVVNLLKGKYADMSANLYNTDPKINLIAGEGRNYLNRDNKKYDLIQLTSTDTWSANSSGAYILTESYLYTQDAISQYIDHLADDGILCLLVWDLIEETDHHQQPINSRLMFQYLKVLEKKGIENPQNHFVILGKKEWYNNIFTVPLVKKSPFTRDEVNALRQFAQDMDFQVLYDPFNEPPPNALSAILLASPEQRKAIQENSFFNLTPITDNQPFFFSCFKWKNVLGYQPKWDAPIYGQAFLLVLLVQSLIFSMLFIMMPLILKRRTSFNFSGSKGYLLYFFALGTGFMFIEISLIQRFVLFLGYPAYAFAATISSLLVFSGFGSYYTSKLRQQPRDALKTLILITAVLILLYTWGLPYLFNWFIGADLATRFLLTIIFQIPLGFVLGMFFPLGIKLVSQVDTRLIPWVWGVNGLSSVLSTVLAILLAMLFGFHFINYLAVGLYLIGTASLLITSKSNKTAEAMELADAVEASSQGGTPA